MFKPPRTVAAIANAALMFLLATHAVGAEKANKADFWTFKPSSKPIVPALRKATRPRNPIDVFILAELEKKGLQPSPEADRRTLLRRITFDLTGLPPTPEEAETFFSDRSGDAHERLVDRLLASPAYGERWARHWLDVVHFGETHGYDKDKLRPHAWPYRDYVIRAFNRDTPWSRFVEEQLAGDILFPDSPDGIVATGFLAAGPWDFVGHVELPESKTDGLIARYNDRDDMVMTTMSSFQSLTVHCARCHDHKFDPITQRDYYNLQAVFAGVDRAERPYDDDPNTFANRRALSAEKTRLTARLEALNTLAAKVSSPELQTLDHRIQKWQETVTNGPVIIGKRGKTLGYHSKIEKNQDISKWVQVDLGSPMPLDSILLVPAFEMFGPHNGPGFGFPVRFRIDTSNDPTFREHNTVTDRTKEDFAHPGNLPFLADVHGTHARYVRVTATKLWKRTDDWIFALGELVVLSKGTNAAARKPVSALDSIEGAPAWAKANLTDGESVLSLSVLDEANAGKNLSSSMDMVTWVLKSHAARQQIEELTLARSKAASRLVPREIRSELNSIKSLLAEVERKSAALSGHSMVYAAANDFKPEGSFLPAKGVRPVHLLLRGDVKRPTDLAQARALGAVPGPDPEFHLNQSEQEGPRRAALARWITDPKNM